MLATIDLILRSSMAKLRNYSNNSNSSIISKISRTGTHSFSKTHMARISFRRLAWLPLHTGRRT